MNMNSDSIAIVRSHGSPDKEFPFVSPLYAHSDPVPPVTEDRGYPTPRHFGDPRQECNTLRENAGLVDFSHLGVVAVSGEERVTFLGGLITQQIRKAGPEQAVYAHMLTAQGRFQWDFTILERDGGFLLVTEPDRVDGLLQRLAMYKLRAKVQLQDARAEVGVLGVIGPRGAEALGRIFAQLELADAPLGKTLHPEPGITLWRDPRHEGYGWRLAAPVAELPPLWKRLAALIPPAGWEAWEHLRVSQALPRGGAEWIPDETLPLEAGLLELHGVDFGKGCFVGQETTARTHHRGTLRRRVYALSFPRGTLPPVGAEIQRADGKEAGIVTSVSRMGDETLGLGLIRQSDRWGHSTLHAAGLPLSSQRPSWATWEEPDGDGETS